jgi:hypothetical protein
VNDTNESSPPDKPTPSTPPNEIDESRQSGTLLLSVQLNEKDIMRNVAFLLRMLESLKREGIGHG